MYQTSYFSPYISEPLKFFKYLFRILYEQARKLQHLCHHSPGYQGNPYIPMDATVIIKSPLLFPPLPTWICSDPSTSVSPNGCRFFRNRRMQFPNHLPVLWRLQGHTRMVSLPVPSWFRGQRFYTKWMQRYQNPNQISWLQLSNYGFMLEIFICHRRFTLLMPTIG